MAVTIATMVYILISHMVCVCVFVCVCVCVCVYVCVCVGVCVLCGGGCVLGSGPEVLSSSPTQAISIYFSICLPPAPPVHPAVIGDLAFAGVQIQGLFS